MSISVLVLTMNEEANLAACLDSVSWSDDIVILDSGSTDRTVDIARERGARVFERKFDNEAAQRAYSLTLPFRHDWVYNPDADEVTLEALRDEMIAVVANFGGGAVAYQCRFRNMFLGRWIRHSSLYPTWVIRLFRPSRLSFERLVNLRYVVDGPVGSLQSHFEHRSFNKGFNAWFEKHNQYSLHEAKESLQALESKPVRWLDVFDMRSSRRRERRAALKELSFRMPLRPLMRFAYMYFLRLGFLDGVAGFHYCALLSVYEYMIVLKMKEIRRRERGCGI